MNQGSIILIHVSSTTTYCSIKNLIQSKNTYSCATADGDSYSWGDTFPFGISLVFSNLNESKLATQSFTLSMGFWFSMYNSTTTAYSQLAAANFVPIVYLSIDLNLELNY